MIRRGLFSGGLAVVILAAGFSVSGIRVNASASLPIGIYRTTSNHAASLIEFCPAERFGSLSAIRGYRGAGDCPDGAEPLMKPIVAVPGDTVEVSPEGVAVNHKLLPNSAPREFDTHRRPLRHWPLGTYQVSPGMVWVISSYNPRSFDSRYFGPVPISAIRQHLRPLITE